MKPPADDIEQRRVYARRTITILAIVIVAGFATPFVVQAVRGRARAKVQSGYVSPTGGWQLVFTGSWLGRVRPTPVQPRPGEAPWREAVDFIYAPLDSTLIPQVLLRLTVYDDTTWVQVSAEPGPPVGTAIAARAHRIYVASLPQSNPFQPGSADAAKFDEMNGGLEGVRRGLKIE